MTMTDTTGERLTQSLAWEHERVQLVQDADSGLRAVIAIHSTALGPSLGGLRWRAYPGGFAEGLDDALRLSRAMTLKASAAGLDLGGGKCVIVDDGDVERRRDRLVALARELERLGGAYITAEDVGTTTADMDVIAEHTAHVVGRSRADDDGGDPSPATARTVLGAIRAALDVLDGDDLLAGATVGVIGLGKVGRPLAESLLDAGAHVVAYDPFATREDVGDVELVDGVEALYARKLDVLAPCALGGMIDEDVAARVRCRVVCGAANNPLTGAAAAQALARRGILFVPDFLANCGGLIYVDGVRRDPEDAERQVERALAEAQARTAAALREARERDLPPSVVAERQAWARVDAARAGATAAHP